MSVVLTYAVAGGHGPRAMFQRPMRGAWHQRPATARLFGYAAAALLLLGALTLFGRTGLFIVVGAVIAFQIWHRVVHGRWIEHGD